MQKYNNKKISMKKKILMHKSKKKNRLKNAYITKPHDFNAK